MNIDTHLAAALIAEQFPQWAHLPVIPVATSGWDNRTFHLGEEMLIRLPSSPDYAGQVLKEQQWLPRLATGLSVQIPAPLGTGKPSERFPLPWSVYRWIPGETVAAHPPSDKTVFARDLADFLTAFQRIDATGGPTAGAQNFHRGGNLAVYDSETCQALANLKDKTCVTLFLRIWENALHARRTAEPVWVHGDISAGNLLTTNGRLTAVIDFGQLGTGDPACDLVIAWTFFDRESRDVFFERLRCDAGTRARAMGWALWKALIVSAAPQNTNVTEAGQAARTLEQIIADAEQ
ncbi:aminoglycoside phosphotransferase family protein [Morganella morganii]|uniref:aminoglycoside phosphotransferase family protein n=1 Tax=Morganella morganii TaxID=582 RepID=UPI0021CE68C1|nr:aminoglycoside phosphotransferase family protein [Morganella morganii]MCU6378515.1 aminoglycoside phosphotransferase family protein [Morganella morganii]